MNAPMFGSVLVGGDRVGWIRCLSSVGDQLAGAETGSFSRWEAVIEVGPGLSFLSDVFRCDHTGQAELCLEDVEFLEATRQAIAG